FSTDDTLHIASGFPSVRIIQRRFDSFAEQCNYGIDHIHTVWVMSLDADYLLSSGLVEELTGLSPSDDIAGYCVAFKYCVLGHPLRSSLYPPRTVLYKRALASYYSDGHAHKVRVRGRVERLRNVIFHDDRKPLNRWL